MAKGTPKPGSNYILGVPELHPGQLMVEQEANAILEANDGVCSFFLCAHRGWWKSSYLLGRMLEHLSTGMPGGWYAPTSIPLKDTRENLFKKALGSDNFKSWYHETDDILRIPGCGPLHFFSLLEEDAARGPTYPMIVGDEWGALPDGVYQRIIEPIQEKSIVAYGKAEAWFTGTPNATGNPKNHFYHNLQLGINGTDPTLKGWIIPLSAYVDQDRDELVERYNPYANPFYKFERLKRGYANAERKKSWRIEWLCEFISDDGGQFERDAIESQCVLKAKEVQVPLMDTSQAYARRPLSSDYRGRAFLTHHLLGYEPKVGGWYQIGVDIGLTNDKVSIQVLDRTTMQMVYFHQFLPFGRDRWFTIYEAIANAYRLFPGKIVVDASGLGSHVQETMRRNYGISLFPVKFGGTNKEPILNHASSLLEDGKVQLFNLPIIKEELGTMQRTARPSGLGYQIKGAKNTHDDAPMAFALMVYGVYPTVTTTDTDARSIVTTPTSVFLHDELTVSIVNPQDAGGFAAAWGNENFAAQYTR